MNTLLRIVESDSEAVQRHRATILDCLKDPDVSIQKRAIELAFALINGRNFATMSKDLIAFMEKTTEVEFKQVCASSMRIAITKFAPTNREAVDYLFLVLKSCGNHVNDDVPSHAIAVASRSVQLQSARHIDYSRLYFCAHHFCPKWKMFTFSQALSHALTNATRRHKYSQ